MRAPCCLRAVWLAWLVNAALACPSLGDEVRLPGHDLSWVLFGSLDAGAPSRFAAVGVKKALAGRADEAGFVVMATAGVGSYRYRSAGVPTGKVEGRPAEASVLVGYQWRIGATTIALFAGPEYRHLSLDPPDPGNRDRGSRWGLRGQAEIWSHPTEATLLTGTVVAGSAGHVWARASAGYRLAELAFVGPEIAAYVNETYNETRLGLHATGLAIGAVTLRISAGALLTGDHRTGAYAALSGWINY